MDDALLTQAWSLHLKGRFAEVNGLLEPQILRYRNDADFYRILGLSCLRLGDWSGGETYLARCLQLDPEPLQQVRLALTAVAMKKRDVSEAVRLCLLVLDADPRCRPAQRALARLRLALATENGAAALTSADWLPLLPRVSKASSWKLPRWVPVGLGVVVVLGAVAAGAWWGWQLVKGWSAPTNTDARPGPDWSGASVPATTQDAQAGARLSLTPDEIQSTVAKVRQLFQNYQDSAARLEINRLLLSNASTSVKDRVKTLLPYLHTPDFARPEPSAAYQEVRGFPELYEGCTVEWTGVVSRLVSGTSEITFDLLLGYQEGQVVEGVIPVRLGFASLLKNSQVVDVLGQVALVDGKWYVEGRGIHVVGYRAP